MGRADPKVWPPEAGSLGSKAPAAGGKGAEPLARGDFYDFSTKITHF